MVHESSARLITQLCMYVAINTDSGRVVIRRETALFLSTSFKFYSSILYISVFSKKKGAFLLLGIKCMMCVHICLYEVCTYICRRFKTSKFAYQQLFVNSLCLILKFSTVNSIRITGVFGLVG